MIRTTEVNTPRARLSYPHLFVARAITPGGKEKFRAVFLIPKSDQAGYLKVKAAYDAAVELGKEKFWKGKKLLLKNPPIKDGDTDPSCKETDDNGEVIGVKPECVGMWVINASSDTQPGLVTSIDRETKVTDRSVIYGGCFVKANINFYPYDTAGNMGVSAALNHVMKVGEGDAFGGNGGSSKDAFADEPDDEIEGSADAGSAEDFADMM